MESEKFKVVFQVEAETKLGDTVFIVGSINEIGAWAITKAVEMKTQDYFYPIWETPLLELHHSVTNFEYKYFIVRKDKKFEWEFISGNRQISIEYLSKKGVYIIRDKTLHSISPQNFVVVFEGKYSKQRAIKKLIEIQQKENPYYSTNEESMKSRTDYIEWVNILLHIVYEEKKKGELKPNNFLTIIKNHFRPSLLDLQILTFTTEQKEKLVSYIKEKVEQIFPHITECKERGGKREFNLQQSNDSFDKEFEKIDKSDYFDDNEFVDVAKELEEEKKVKTFPGLPSNVPPEFKRNESNGNVQWEKTHFIFCLDCSGSMKGKRWVSTIIGYRRCLNYLKPMKDVLISAFSYDDKVHSHIKHQPVEKAREEAYKIFFARGSTNFSEALKEAIELMTSNPNIENYFTVLFFLSDGSGGDPKKEIERLQIFRSTGKQFMLYTISCQADDATDLTTMCGKLKGKHFSIEEAEEMKTLFTSIISTQYL